MATDTPALIEAREALAAADRNAARMSVDYPTRVDSDHLRTALAEYDALRARMDERVEEYEVISSEDRTEYSLVTVDTAPDDPRQREAGDVAGIVGWMRAKVNAAYGSGQVPGTVGWTYREIANAIERGDWRETGKPGGGK